MACDFFTMPTVTFRVLFVFIMLVHERRRIVHFNATEHPTAQWTAQQIVEAFPWETVPRSLWQNPYGERVSSDYRDSPSRCSVRGAGPGRRGIVPASTVHTELPLGSRPLRLLAHGSGWFRKCACDGQSQ